MSIPNPLIASFPAERNTSKLNRSSFSSHDQRNQRQKNPPHGRSDINDSRDFRTPANNRSRINQGCFQAQSFESQHESGRKNYQMNQMKQMKQIHIFEEGKENRHSLDEKNLQKRFDSNSQTKQKPARRESLMRYKRQNQPNHDRKIEVKHREEFQEVHFQIVEIPTFQIKNEPQGQIRQQQKQEQLKSNQCQNSSKNPNHAQEQYEHINLDKNQQQIKPELLMIGKNLDDFRIDHQKTPSFISQLDKLFSQVDKKYFDLPEILPKMPENISYQELILTHPWSLKNPNKIEPQSQPKTLQRFVYDELIGTYFMLLKQQKKLENTDFVYEHLLQQNINSTVDSRAGFNELLLQSQREEPFERFFPNYSRQLERYEHKKKCRLSEQENGLKKALEKLENYETSGRNIKTIIKKKSDQQDREKRKAEQRKLIAKISRKKSSRKTSIPSSNLQVSCSEFSVNGSKSTNNSSSTSNISPNSQNSINTKKKLQKKPYKSHPQVSQFKISEYDKPFSKKYCITLDSYEQSAWKWWFFRMKNEIKGKYRGEVNFERFISRQNTQRSLIHDMLLKNQNLLRLFDDSRRVNLGICFEFSQHKNQKHDQDLTGVVVLPLQLLLPQGYKYSYDRYYQGCVQGLQIQNEFVKIHFYEPIKFKLKNETQRNWRKKLLMERNRVWLGDDLLRKFAVMTFFKPESPNVFIEGEPEHLKIIVNHSEEYDVQKVLKSNHRRTIQKNPEVSVKVNWIKNPDYKDFQLRKNLEILVYCVGFILFGIFFNYCFPGIRK